MPLSTPSSSDYQDAAWLNNKISDLISIIPVFIQGPKAAIPSPASVAASAVFSGLAQQNKDAQLPLTQGQSAGRVAIAAGEGAVTSVVGSGVGLAAGAAASGVTGPSPALLIGEIVEFGVGFGAGYLFTSAVAGTYVWPKANEFLFPYFGLEPSQ